MYRTDTTNKKIAHRAERSKNMNIVKQAVEEITEIALKRMIPQMKARIYHGDILIKEIIK